MTATQRAASQQSRRRPFCPALQGTALYDAPVSQALLLKWSAMFAAFRPLLATGDLVHIARPNGQTLDAVLHAKVGFVAAPGLLCIWNPTDADVMNGTLVVPLYYTGINSATALVTWEPWPAAAAASASVVAAALAAERPAGAPAWPAPPPPSTVPLDWRRRAVVSGIVVPARSMTWATVAAA